MPSAPQTTNATLPGFKLKKMILIAGLVLAAAVLLFFVVTSGPFVRSVVLPRVARSLGVDITAARVSLRVFSHAELKRVSITAPGGEPIFSADEIRARYSLISILRGRIQIDEVTLVSPDLRIAQEADGTTNLDPLLAGGGSSQSAKESGPPQLAVRNVSVKSGRVALAQKSATGAVTRSEITGLDLALDRLENGQSGKLTVDAAVRSSTPAASGAQGDSVIEGRLNGAWQFTFDPQLRPRELSGSARLDLARAEGGYSELRGASVVLASDLTPTELRQLSLRLERGGQRLGQVLVSGPFDLVKSEARLRIEVQSIDRQILNALGAAQGVDFGSSTFNSTSVVDVSKDWKLIAATGGLSGQGIEIKQAGTATPAINLNVDYQAQIDLAAQTAILQKLNIRGQQAGADLITGALDRPMNITWAPEARGFAESTFQCSVTNLNLGDWRAFLPEDPPAGRVSARFKVVAQRDARALAANGQLLVEDLNVALGTNRINRARLALLVDATMEDFRTVDARSFELTIDQPDGPLLKASGSGRYDVSSGDMSAHCSAEAALTPLLRQVPVEGLAANRGTARASAAYTRKAGIHTAAGSLALADFSGVVSGVGLDNYHVALEYTADLSGDVLRLNKGNLALRQGFGSGGSVDLKGEYNLADASARFTCQLLHLNENALSPFLTTALGGNKLVRLTTAGGGTVTQSPNGRSTLEGDVRLENLVLQRPGAARPEEPVTLSLRLDAALHGQLVELKECALALTPTLRAKNQLQIQGRLHLNPTNTAPSELRIASDGMDLTPYQAWLLGGTNAPAPAAVSTPAAPGEPEPVQLPFSRLTATARINRLFLKEIDAANVTADLKTSGSTVVLDPFQCSLNGAPVTGRADLNLGVPGYTYDLTFKAGQVPVEPLVNSLTANEPGQFKGELIADARIRGAGTTGSSLRRSLQGAVSLSITNMDLQILSYQPKGPFDPKRLIQPIATVLGLGELLQSPLAGLEFRSTLGNGAITVDQFAALSPAFYAEARGAIPIADVLTNSPLNLPVNLALRRSIAEKANLVPSDAPTNTAYVALPDFVKVTGTLGAPATQTDKLVIAGLLARTSTRLVPAIGGAVGNVIEGVRGLLNPSGTAATNAPAGAAAPRAKPADTLLQGIQGLGNLFGGRRSPPPTPLPPASGSSTNQP